MSSEQLNSLVIGRAAGSSFGVPERDLGRLSLIALASGNPILAIVAARSMANADPNPDDGECEDPKHEPASPAELAQAAAEEAAVAKVAAEKAEKAAEVAQSEAIAAAVKAENAAAAAEKAAAAAQQASGDAQKAAADVQITVKSASGPALAVNKK